MFHLTTALDAASGVPLYEQLYEDTTVSTAKDLDSSEEAEDTDSSK